MTPGKIIARLLYWQPKLFDAMPLVRERCVLATRVGIDVLARFGIEAVPRPVIALVNNLEYEAFHAQVQAAASPEEAQRLPVPADGFGVWSGTDDVEVRPKHWRGHLVVYVPSRQQFMDLDFQAFSRPAKGMAVAPALLGPWPEGQRAVHLTGRDDQGRPVFAHYERNDDNQGFVDGPDWDSSRELARAAVECIERAIRKGGPTP